MGFDGLDATAELFTDLACAKAKSEQVQNLELAFTQAGDGAGDGGAGFCQSYFISLTISPESTTTGRRSCAICTAALLFHKLVVGNARISFISFKHTKDVLC